MARLVLATAYRLGSRPRPSFTVKTFCKSLTNSTSLPTLTLFTKENCQLCDEALEQLEPFLHQVKLEEIDIEEDGKEDYFNKFRYEIPVFFLNNKFLCKNKIDLEKLQSALQNQS